MSIHAPISPHNSRHVTTLTAQEVTVRTCAKDLKTAEEEKAQDTKLSVLLCSL